MTDFNSQSQRVLKALQSGRTVTRLTSMFDLGIANLPARIKDLRDAGYDIKTVMHRDLRGKRYAKYYLNQ